MHVKSYLSFNIYQHTCPYCRLIYMPLAVLLLKLDKNWCSYLWDANIIFCLFAKQNFIYSFNCLNMYILMCRIILPLGCGFHYWKYWNCKIHSFSCLKMALHYSALLLFEFPVCVCWFLSDISSVQPWWLDNLWLDGWSCIDQYNFFRRDVTGSLCARQNSGIYFKMNLSQNWGD